jgi:hypothetical protein
MMKVNKCAVVIVVGVKGAASSAVSIPVKPGKYHGRASSAINIVSFQELELARVSKQSNMIGTCVIELPME